MSEIIEFASWARPDKADPVPKEMSDFIIAAGGTRDKAEWVFKELVARSATIPPISLQMHIPNNLPMLKEAMEALLQQIDAREQGVTTSLLIVLCELYDARWPPNDGGGNRHIA